MFYFIKDAIDCKMHPKFKSAKNWREKKDFKDFPGGTVVKNSPANAGNTGLRPGPGRSHMLWNN